MLQNAHKTITTASAQDEGADWPGTPSWRLGRAVCTYRKFEVGADATDASADNPGSDEDIELDAAKSSPPVPERSPNLSAAPSSGSASEGWNVEFVHTTPVAAWRESGGASIDEVVLL